MGGTEMAGVGHKRFEVVASATPTSPHAALSHFGAPSPGLSHPEIFCRRVSRDAWRRSWHGHSPRDQSFRLFTSMPEASPEPEP